MRIRAGIAGIVGLVVALGVTELVHGLYDLVPSVLGSIAQVVVEWTPGGIVTQGIELLGTADVPVLIGSVVIGTLAVSALLGILAVRRPALALLGVALLTALGIAVSFVEPFINPVATVANVVVGLLAGTIVAELMLRAAGLREVKKAALEAAPAGTPGSPESPAVRWRETGAGSMSVGRGGFLALGGGAVVAGLAALGLGRLLSGGSQTASAPKRLDLSNEPAGKPSGNEGESDGGGKEAVTHETLPKPPADASIDLPGMPKLITPAANFYLIDAALTSPRVNADDWKLSVKGAVQNPVEFSYKDLQEMSTLESDVTLSCVSNTVGGGLVSNGRWTGVLLSDVLKEAGVSRENISSASRQLVGRSVDGWTAGFETDIALDGREALVAFGLNGSELPVKHGYPVRLVVPGLYGYVSATKWLSEIELTSWDFDAYWIQRTWTKEGPVKTQSRIDTVKGGDNLQAGRVPVGGVAWAPHRGIDKVEVSTDNGNTWNEARLASQLHPDTWRQYVYDWDAKPGSYTLKVRATDGEGVLQTAEDRPPHGGGGTDGAQGYHTMEVTVA
ncbi:molybdopterin-dependent oxidoreductase [Rubrobacter tropicus]|uniref:Molybdopterin-dependent oxidoreductase n=1 Tax=Rubrobacter tropicus TaxID=2653851 RepID=A0A6G8Q609_9ACTN|nr:molybdopterin-dependent oxidoreductase [Rubrobacter tropicus]QIN81915.1 molybdopterin-dependent oxidoreductase [Rubrobacter tropicus]